MHCSLAVAHPMSKIDIVMGVRQEGEFLAGTLADIIAQESDLLGDVIVALAPSSDGTRDVLDDAASGILEGRLQVIDNEKAWVAVGLNLALSLSSAQFVARVDGHCSIPANFLTGLMGPMIRDPKIAYCGPRMLTGDGAGARAAGIAAAMESPLGVGGGNFRLKQESGYVATVLLGIYRRAALDAVGHFDERLQRNQDDELHDRLRAAGYRIWQEVSVEGTYYPRRTLWALFRQYHGYGWWKFFAATHAGTELRPKHVVPATLVTGLLVTALITPISVWPLMLSMAAYATVLCLQAVVGWKSSRRVGVGLWSAVASAVMHVAYGLGFLASMLEGLASRLRWGTSGEPR